MARRAANSSIALLLAATVAGCGDQSTGSSTVASSAGQAPTESVGPPPASAGPAATATTATAVTTTLVHPAEEPPGEPAPDFTLALGSGGQFHLSEASKPVYLVFWAEW